MKIRVLLVFLCILALGAGGLAYLAVAWATSPLDPGAGEVIVEIPRGQGFGETTRQLVRSGCIDRPRCFKWLARYQKDVPRIKSGEYRLSAAMTPREILQTLVRGKSILHRLTIVEGANLEDMALSVEKAGFCPAGDFIKAARDPGIVKKFGHGANSLEGYLFPDTYYFSRNPGPEKIIKVMADRFGEVFSPGWSKRARQLGLTRHEAVTLASIIEKETGKEGERALVSSVFHNRLKKGMRLQSDPTVIYGIPDFDGNLTKKHLKTRTPYNTYVIPGLPPGPIASPGEKSLHAALFPASSQYLFFVSNNKGAHVFSETLAKHRRAVNQYQRRKGAS